MSDDLKPAEPAVSPVQTQTWWQQVSEWKQAGVPRPEWATRLKAAGLDDESISVVINSVDGKTPESLPEASFVPTTNALAPGAFAFTDLGIKGNPSTVGLYWLTFGGAVLLMVGVFALLVALEVVQQPADQIIFIARVMTPIAIAAIGFGAWQLAGNVRVRRR